MALQAITSEGQGREACGHRAQFGAPCLESKDADTLQLGSGLFILGSITTLFLGLGLLASPHIDPGLGLVPENPSMLYVHTISMFVWCSHLDEAVPVAPGG